MILKNTTWGARCTLSPNFTLYFTDDEVTLSLKGKKHVWPLPAIGTLETLPGLVWAAIVITPLEGVEIRLGGVDKKEGDRWQAAFTAAHLKRVAETSNEACLRFLLWSGRVEKDLPTQWHPSWLAHQLYKTRPTPKLSCGVTYDSFARHPALAQALAAHPDILRTLPEPPERWISTTLERRNEQRFREHVDLPLFETLEATPLTQEQRRAVICFDSKLLVVAAAGSGKTATMVAKAAYAITMGIVRPEEILMLAFNTDAATELQERVDKRLVNLANADQVACRTFHSFGLSVIGEAAGAKPRPAAWLEGGQDVAKVVALMKELAEKDKAFGMTLMLVRTVFAEPLGNMSSNCSDPVSSTDVFVTCRGETVKSREEQLIADWLFINGVNYQYEVRYKVDTADAQHSQYHPDFYYPEIDLYHEHFALDAAGNPPPHFKDYAAGVAWKRALHQEHQTQLVETTSYTLRTGEGLKALEQALVSRGIKLNPDPDRMPPGRPPLDNEALAKILRNLMTHAKGNQLDVGELTARASRTDPLRGPLIVSLYAEVLRRWQEDLAATNTVDFDDMINMAIEQAESSRYRSPYKLVIADEYQDSSVARARLLRAITTTPGTFLCVVGDDWQSINRFAGADSGVMRRFKSFYGSGTVLQLTRTFRCPEQICRVSSDFVQQNPDQLPKEVSTTSTVTGNAIQCFAAGTHEEMTQMVERMLTRLAKKLQAVWDSPRKPTVMLMGRYRSDRPANWGQLNRICGPGIDLTFTTVHSSKGTEADYVLLLNVIKGRRGFPSEIEDDPILQIAMPDPEVYPFAEERRLFYVALTRARRGIFIFTLAQRPSRFLVELQKRRQIVIVGTDGAPIATDSCPKCGEGFRKLKTGRYGDFYGCSNHPACNWTENVGVPGNHVNAKRPSQQNRTM
ncbi:UvrD-helicase domain-containing protein [Pseudomonas sp. JM0905a]|uniref:UvrD-helicase domain-containing protein n=1 Tax=Pseudomonas sp. JM0905a TaxID=2772484 RepID=UPI001683FA3F|nr:UvrD-helicase domain-containing protein [Pseudomonas sp. JM0905a]MBD2837113.1 UvrD-helicase domain-containing protein [Pseudomonas sp. JM0905a]